MNGRSLWLQPFPSTNAQPDIKVTCNIARHSNKLDIRFELLGGTEEIIIPAPAEIPLRKKNLWDETCFEFFAGIRNSPRYWEFNLSPAGHWNVFLFDAYRQGMQEEMAFPSLPFLVQSGPASLQLTLTIDFNKIIRIDQLLEAAVSAVIKKRDGETTYWALTHKGYRPDFHRRDSFIIEL